MVKKLLFFMFGLILLSSCATYKLDKAIWFNLSPAEKEGVKGTVVTSLYFTSDKTVDIYSSVKVDTALVVKPFKWAKGAYSVSGNPKKEANLSITAINLRNDTVKYSGIYQKDETMFLVSDSIVNVFHKMPYVKLP
jgi:hypothetical protein